MALDMNIFDKIIEEDLEEFDFDEAHRVMTLLDHKWYMGRIKTDEGELNVDELEKSENYKIPTAIEIRKELRKDLITRYTELEEMKERYEECKNGLTVTSSCGGYRIIVHYNEDDGYWADIMYCPVETLR